MRVLLVCLVSLLATGVSAQSALTLTPGRLFYQAETTVTVSNASGTPVVLDSLGMRFGEDAPRAYTIQASGPDSTYGSYYLTADLSYSERAVIGAALPSGAVATLDIVGFDPCIICRGGGGAVQADTLLVYSGGEAVPDTVLIDLSNYVAADPGPAAPSALVVDVYPNPATRGFVVEVSGERRTPVDVGVVDVTGRIVHRVRIQPGDGQARVPTSGLAPGAYLVRAVWPDGRRAMSRVVVAR